VQAILNKVVARFDPSPSVLRKAKLWNDSIARNCWRNAGETFEITLA